MNATTFEPATAGFSGGPQPRLLGLGNLVRKDLADWLHSKRPWVVGVVTTSVFALAAANSRITEWAIRSLPADPGEGPAKVLSVLPMDNLLFAIATGFMILATIFATMSIFLAERDSETLAWTISKPVSRTSVLVSKWLTSTVVLWLAAVVIPLAATTALVTALYGLPDPAVIIALGISLILVPAFFVAVALTTATFVPSQAAVGAIGLTVFVLTAANARITEWAAASFPADPADGPAKVMSVLPLDNLLIALGTQFIVLAAIFATMSLLVAERDSGTLAWTISKPVSRTSVLVSKWLTSTLILWVAAVLVPLSLTTAVVAILYGAPNLAAVAELGVLLIAVPAFFVAVALVAATFVPSQAAVGAIGLAVLAVPPILGGIIPAAAPFFPTSIFDWAVAVSTGGPASPATPIAWFVGMAALLLVARRRLNAMDL